MRIVQTYQTFDGENLKQGFKTLFAFKQWIMETYFTHTVLTDDYKIYTDKEGYNVLKELIDDDHIEIVEFKRMLRDRIPYLGKFCTYEKQTKPFIHVDIDMKLYKLPEIADIMSEGHSFVEMGKEANILGLRYNGFPERIWSGLLGFTDIEFKNEYVKRVFEKVAKLEEMKPFEISKRLCISLEEDLLSILAHEHKKSISYCNENDLLHLRDNLK